MIMLLVAMGAKHPGVFEEPDFLLKLLRLGYLIRKMVALSYFPEVCTVNTWCALIARKQPSRLEV